MACSESKITIIKTRYEEIYFPNKFPPFPGIWWMFPLCIVTSLS